MLFCVYKHDESEDTRLYATLDEEAKGMSKRDSVTPFAKAGFLSTLSFGWLNSLMKRGTEKTLNDEDIPNCVKRIEQKVVTRYSWINLTSRNKLILLFSHQY